MQHFFRYSLLTPILYSAAVFAAQCPVSNVTRALHTNNGITRFQPSPTAVYAFGNFGLDTQKRMPKKLPISYSNNKDVGQTMLDHATFLTFCDVKKHMPIIRDHIDERLGVSKDSWFRAIKGTYHSTIQAFSLNEQETIQELKVIDSLVSNICYPGLFYEELSNQHRYVYLLLQAVIKKEAEKFHQVRGSTIDYMRDEERRIADLSTDLSRFINDRAKCLYSRWIHISHSDEYSPCRPLVLLCFQAFENSRYSVEELIKLRDSQAMSKLHIKMSETKRACLASSRTVEYLFNNLHDEIEKRLHELTSEKDESDEEGVFGLMLLAALLAFF